MQVGYTFVPAFAASRLVPKTCGFCQAGFSGLRFDPKTDRQTGESPLKTCKRPESVCGEFAGRTTGSSVVVRVSLTDATPVAIWTSRLEKFRKSTPTHPLAILGSGA